ncbi:MAG: ion channel [Paracoccaceae bacterium]
MRPEYQILLGSVFLCVCAIWHIFAVTELIARLRKRFGGTHDDPRTNFYVTVYVFLGIVGAHTVQLYLWALAFWLTGAIEEFPTAIYFSLVTYTALGYGDVVLGENFRIFGAMESITGLLMFGITTAFLVGYFSILMKKR